MHLLVGRVSDLRHLVVAIDPAAAAALLLVTLVACKPVTTASAPPLGSAPRPSSSDVAPLPRARACTLHGTTLEADVCNASGERVATLRLLGGSFQLAVGTSLTSASGARSGVTFEGSVCTEGLHVWPKERLDLIEGHAWVEPATALDVASARNGAVRLRATPAQVELAGPFDCERFTLTPGEAKHVASQSYNYSTSLNAAEVPVFDAVGRPLATWSGEGRTLYGVNLREEANGMRHLDYMDGPVVWDVWLKSESIETKFLLGSSGGGGLAGIGSITSNGDVGEFRLGAPAPIRRRAVPARVARLAKLKVGAAPGTAVASGIELAPEVGILVHEDQGDLTAISFADQAVSAPHGQDLWIETSAIAPH